jgi:hypothetical protein
VNAELSRSGPVRQETSAAGFGQGEAAARSSAEELTNDIVERVRREKFSWLSRKVLIESRNDLFAKVHDVVLDERPRWVAAQRAAGVENACPDFRIDRKDLGAFTCLLLGDPGEGDISQWAVARALPLGEAESHFMVIVSDVVYAAGDVNQYVEKFYEPYEQYPHVIYALPGNHDWYDGLDGFMFHFCGTEALARVSYRTSSLPVRERLTRVLWRKASRPDRAALMGRRASRPPFSGADPARPPQPGPYWCLETQHLALVAIDTGINGTIDHEQGDWLLRVSQKVDKPKVLLTGKPFYANNKYARCEIEWGAGPPRAFRTVDDVVRHKPFGYVAAIGGDTHNYQRYPIPVGDRTIQYIVSGGAGAFMSRTHQIDLAEHLQGPDGNAGITEQDTRLFPLRGDSLARYTQEFVARAPKYLAQTLMGLLAIAGLVWLLSHGEQWALWRAGAIAAGVGVVQLVYGLVGTRERLARLVVYGLTLVVVGLALVLFDLQWRDGLSHDTVTVVLVAATVGLPIICVAIAGWQPRRFAALLGVLLGLALATWVLHRSAIQTGVEIAVVALSVVVFCVALRAAARLSGRGKGRLGAVVVLGVVALGGGLSAAFLAWDVGDVLACMLAGIAVLAAAYFVALGIIPTALVHRGRRIDDDIRLTNHAAKFLAVRMGISPVRPAADAVDGVDPRYHKLFNRVYPKGKLWQFSPFHNFMSQILDFDQPPLAKNFLELEVKTDLLGPAQLVIRCYAVSGLPPGERTLFEEIGPIPLAAP